MELWTIRKILAWTAEDLAGRGVESARLDAEVLLAHTLATDRLGLFLDLDRPLTEDERARFRQTVLRRRRREPVAQITGVKEFWSLTFRVDRHVLIPRPDTEVVVEEALELAPAGGGIAADVGTGSGCIALALAREREELRVLALDIDRRAATVAATNAAGLGLDHRVAVALGDLLEPVAGPIDLVVANLPYIPSGHIQGLEPEVSQWEPRLALDGGPEGLDLFPRLIAGAARALRRGGGLVLEVGDQDQAERVGGLLERGWELLRVRRDYGGSPRAVVARRR